MMHTIFTYREKHEGVFECCLKSSYGFKDELEQSATQNVYD